MRFLKYLVLGILFGVILIKSEVASWFRIQEMFRFQAFHMYGIIGSAIAVGVLSVWLIRKWELQTICKEKIVLTPGSEAQKGHLIGGLLFGFGWAVTGACPGPIYALIGNGYPTMAIVLISAIAGAYVFGMVEDKMP